MTVGLLVRRFDLNDFDRGLWRAAYERARESDSNLILVEGRGDFGPGSVDTTRMALYSMLSPALVDACILSQTVALWESQEQIESFAATLPALPTVSASIQFGNRPCVWVDNASGLRELMRHLIHDHHCRRIVHVRGPQVNREAQLREDTWREELVRAGIEVRPEWLVQGHFWSERLKGIGKKVLEQTAGEFDAVVACNDAAALCLLEDFQALGYRVPEDYVVCGFDDTTPAQLAEPPLTTVQQPIDALLNRCWDSVEAFWKSGRRPPDAWVPTTLVVRRSCGCLLPTTRPRDIDWEGELATRERALWNMLDRVRDLSEFDRAMNQVTDEEGLKRVLAHWLPVLGIERFAILSCSSMNGTPTPFVSHEGIDEAVDGPPAFTGFQFVPEVRPVPRVIPSAELSLPSWFAAIEPYAVGVFPLVAGRIWYGVAFLQLAKEAGIWERSVQEQVASVFHRLDLVRQNLEEQSQSQARTEQLMAHRRLIGEIAHQINTPLGAIISSSASIDAGMSSTVTYGTDFIQALSLEGRLLCMQLQAVRQARTEAPSGSAARALRSQYTRVLVDRVAHPEPVAEGLVTLGWQGSEDELVTMARVEELEAVVSYLVSLEDLTVASWVVGTAAQKVAAFVAQLVKESQAETKK